MVEPQDQCPPKILVVDDEPAFLDLTQLLLEEAHYQVITTDNGPDAVNMAGQENPDLIILDITMPELDGYQTLDKMNTEIPNFNTPVIFLSGRVSAGNQLRSLFSGAVEQINKPIESKEEFLEKVKSLLYQR